MEAASKGARQAGGLTVGILPGADKRGASESVDIPIVTDMGSARNNINVLSSDVVIACGMGPGTASEIALAIKARRKVILLNDSSESKDFFRSLSGETVVVAETPRQVMEAVKKLLKYGSVSVKKPT